MWLSSRHPLHLLIKDLSGMRPFGVARGASSQILTGATFLLLILTPLGTIVSACTSKWFSQKKNYHAYLSIPYAEPPVGFLRFKEPLQPRPWEGIRTSLYDSVEQPSCVHLARSKIMKGSEDCLYLNVYVPEGGQDGGMPVVVYLHGDMFRHGNPSVYGPDRFMEHKVILVTINYRIGPFGFLSFENEMAPGNLGLRDQIQALTWVKENIGFFGGNPDSVTLMGHESGAGFAMFLMTSPKAQGLFHRIIVHSGSLLSAFNHLFAKPRSYAMSFSTALGCHTLAALSNRRNASKQIIDCLSGKSTKELFLKQESLMYEKDLLIGPNAWLPYTDKGKVRSHVLIDSPVDSITSNHYDKVPMLIGDTADDGLVDFLKHSLLGLHEDELDSRWDRMGPLMLLHLPIEDITLNDIKVSQDLMKSYIKGNDNHLSRKMLFKMLGDSSVRSGISTSVRFLAESNHKSVYRFRISHTPEYAKSGLNRLMDRKDMCVDNPGQCKKDYLAGLYGSDLFMLFKPFCAKLDPLQSSEDQEISRTMFTYWINFIKNGNPNVGDPVPAMWTPARSMSLAYLNISSGQGGPRMEYSAEARMRDDQWYKALDEVVLHRSKRRTQLLNAFTVEMVDSSIRGL